MLGTEINRKQEYFLKIMVIDVARDRNKQKTEDRNISLKTW